jgi:hypothetical protein
MRDGASVAPVDLSEERNNTTAGFSGRFFIMERSAAGIGGIDVQALLAQPR